MIRLQLFQFFALNAAYFTAATFLFWLLSLVRVRLWRTLSPWRESAAEAAFALLLTLLVFSLAHVGFRVFSDETNLLSVANNIAGHMRAVNDIQGYFMPGGVYISITNEIPTRPLMFSFLTALVHWFRGIHPDNVFILNFVLLFLLLFSFARLFAPRYGNWKFLWVAVLATNASLAIHAVSGGFDLCSLLFGVWTFVALLTYLERGGEEHLALLVMTSLCFVQVRYESLAVLPFLLVAVILGRGKTLWKEMRGPWLVLLGLVLLMPVLVQRGITWGRFENPPGLPAFSLLNIFHHFPEVASFFFLRWRDVYPCGIDLLGIAGGICILRRPRSRATRIFVWTLFAYGIFLTLLLLAHFMGIAESSTQIRLFMPLTVLLWLAAVGGWDDEGRSHRRWVLAVVSVGQIGLGLAYIHRDPQMQNLALAQETRELRKLFAAEDFSRTLFLYRRPGQLIALGRSAVLPEFYQHNEAQIRILLKAGIIKNVDEIISRPVLKPGPLPYEPLPGWRRDFRREIPVTGRFRVELYELTPE